MQTLESILESYAFEKMQNNGLLLIPLPTGAGKSYTVFSFIHNVLVQQKTNQQILFVTSLKKNLQIGELEKHFTTEVEKQIFKDKVILLKSNLDCVLDNFLNIDKNIPLQIKETREYKQLNAAIKYCFEMENNVHFRTNYQVIDTVKNKKDDIYDKYEPNFRRKIKAIINEKVPIKSGYKQRLTFVKDKMPWLLELYPQILSNEKQVFLMSMDKFLLRNDTIVDKSYFVYKKLAKDAIVFIDEFDATKETILSRLIDNATDSRIDYAITYKMIHDTLEQGIFPRNLTTPSEITKKRYEQGGLRKRLEDVIPNLKERSDKLYKQFNMQYFFKNIETENEDAAFLFQDIHSIAISNKDNKSRIVFKENVLSNLNEIYYLDRKSPSESTDNSKSFVYMVKSVRAFLQTFSASVHILALNLQQLQNESGIEDYTLEEAIRSVLDIFFSGDSFTRIKEYFVKQILLYRSNLEENKKKEFDGSFFENGFSYYVIEDNNNHTLRSAIMMTSLESTPERILLDVCKKAKVFGISATANYNTLIGNYALDDYIIPKLKKHYYQLNESEYEVLEKQFNESIKHYEKVKIHTLPINSDYNYNRDSWKTVFNKDEDCEEIYNILNQSIPATFDTNNYLKNRYLRIAKVFKVFLETKEIKSFLCMLTKFPDDKNELNKGILQKLFEKLSHGSKLFDDTVVILRSGNDYEVTKEDLLNKLAHGEKKLVLSTYATIGAGQNLQYKVLTDIETEFINDFKPSEEKDFDAIYLDKPTNLIKQLRESNTEEDFTEYLAQLEYLMTSGELSRKQVFGYVEAGFKYHYYNLENRVIDASNIDSSTNLAAKVLVQAVGRLCRTNRKSKNIYIYYDDAIKEILNVNTCKKNLLNPEFRELIKNIGQSPIPDKTIERLSEEAIEKSEEALSRIMKYVQDGRNGWKDYAIEQWQLIRHWVLQHPTLSREEYNNCDDLFQPFYIELPKKGNKVWFSRTGDYKSINDISFEPKPKYECVSAESARLEKFLHLPGILQLFENEGFATQFVEKDFILCSPVFTNIYKGALGEYTGREILRYHGIELEEITNHEFFELFDFKIPNKDIYIDFKHWNHNSAFRPYAGALRDHISEKLDRVSGKKAIIINLFANKKESRPFLTNERIIEIPFLFDDITFNDNTLAIQKLIDDIKREI
ncbi:hypothetical protein [Treponema bryantii]|uniref:hypothetical protein n=1 Tax=Treponema bryantii TaxID=163 RepID=UPI0003B5D080|nr:hypothetical protein [Treponema bryantii]